MNKLEILLKKWKAGSIRDPDLSLCLSYINGLLLERSNERTVEHKQGPDPVSGEGDIPAAKRFKVKGLREGV